MPVTLLPVLAIFGVCLVNALAWIGQPFSGFLILQNGIVVSIGRTQWTQPRYRNLPFARVLAVDGHPVSDGQEIHAYERAIRPGKPIIYTLRKGTTIFRLASPLRPFEKWDFLELFTPMLGVGLLMALGGAAIVARRPEAPEARAFFVVCLSLGLMLLTGPDQYGPYRLGRLFFLSLCAIPPAFLQLALSYPERRALLPRQPIAYVVLYVPFGGLGVALLSTMPEPSLFLPLLYTVWLLTANAVLLYVGGLVLGLIEGVRPRKAVVLALAAVVGSCLLAVSILVAYPLLRLPISPAWFVSPLLLLPVLKGVAFLRFAPPPGRDTRRPDPHGHRARS